MTGAGGCGEIRRVLGVYVLGAIDPAGRALVVGPGYGDGSTVVIA